MNNYKPPFHITEKIISLVAKISEQIGRIDVLKKGKINPRLRRQNRIKTIHSSLAIEQNTLTLEQITAILDGKRVLGNPNEIKEVKNAYDAYKLMLKLNPLSVNDLLKAHKLMMKDLLPENGHFRSEGVGVYDGKKLVHLAPPAEFVRSHINNLISWYKKSELHPLIKSAIFHYEFEFIHPFSDGNGRTGRMWHTLLLSKWKEIFLWIPIEELIRKRQNEYYDTLGASDKTADGTKFIELMLEIIWDTLKKMKVIDRMTGQDTGQDAGQDDEQKNNINQLLKALGNKSLSANELMEKLNFSHRQTFRENYINPALKLGVIERTIPDKPNSKYQKYRKVKKK